MVAWASGLLLAGLLVGALFSVQECPWGTGAACGIAVVFLLLHGIVGHRNPNRNLSANLARASADVDNRRLELLRVGAPAPVPDAPDCRPPLSWWVVLGLVAVGVVVLASPELVRLLRGWPVNADWRPIVVGPDEQMTFMFPDEFQSLDGKWSGTATVEVLNIDEVGLRDRWLRTVPHDDRWSDTFGLPSNAKQKTWRLSVNAIAPTADLGGKELLLRIELRAKYPADFQYGATSRDIRVEEHTFTALTTLRVAATPEAGKSYCLTWWGCTFLGGIWVLGAGLALGGRQVKLGAKALPTLVTPVKDA